MAASDALKSALKRLAEAKKAAIEGKPSTLTTRTVTTVPIDPKTGMPPADATVMVNNRPGGTGDGQMVTDPKPQTVMQPIQPPKEVAVTKPAQTIIGFGGGDYPAHTDLRLVPDVATTPKSSAVAAINTAAPVIQGTEVTPLPRKRPPPKQEGGGFDFLKTVGDLAGTVGSTYNDLTTKVADAGGAAVNTLGGALSQGAQQVNSIAPLMGLLRMFQPNTINSASRLAPDGSFTPNRTIAGQPLYPAAAQPMTNVLKYGATPEARIAADQKRTALMTPGVNSLSTSGDTYRSSQADTHATPEQMAEWNFNYLRRAGLA